MTTGTTSGYYSATTSNPYGWETITVAHPIPETIPYTTDTHTILTSNAHLWTSYEYVLRSDDYRGSFTGSGAASQPAERDEEEDIEVDSNAFGEFMGFDE